MAAGSNFSCYYEEPILEKLPACTMKRYTKVDLDKSDMLKLLSYLEGELQARDIVVAALNTEKVKQMVSKAKKYRSHPDDPLYALQRDSELVRDCSFGEAEVKSMYDEQLNKLENLIGVQQAAQKSMREVLAMVERKCHKMTSKLESDRSSHAREVEQDELMVRLLEKERDKLKLELEHEKVRHRKLEAELKRVASCQETGEGSSDQDVVIAVQLIKEQTKMMRKTADLRQYATSLTSEIQAEKRKAEQLERCLAEETERVMHEEATQEKQLSEFDFEKQQLLARVGRAEAQQRELLEELAKLQLQQQATTHPDASIQNDKPKAEQQNGLKSSAAQSILKISSTTTAIPHQQQQPSSYSKRPSSAQCSSAVVTTKLLPAFQPSKPLQTNTPKNFSVPHPPLPTAAVSGLQPPRVRTSVDGTSRGQILLPQNSQIGKKLPPGVVQRAPPPVPPNKPQMNVLPPSQQQTIRHMRPSSNS